MAIHATIQSHAECLAVASVQSKMEHFKKMIPFGMGRAGERRSVSTRLTILIISGRGVVVYALGHMQLNVKK